MAKRMIIAAVLLAIVFGGLAWFNLVFKPDMLRQYMAQNRPPPVTVAAQTAESESWQPHLSAIGTLEAVNGVTVAPQVSGVVREIRFESGEETMAGTLLIQLDDSVEQADLKSNQAILREAALALERAQQLYQRQQLPKANLDEILARRDQAAASVERTQAEIERKAVRAPFDGRLGIRQIDLGEYLSPGTPVVSLVALDPIYVDFPLPEQELRKLHVGQPVTVTVDAFPGRGFEGTITSIDARVNQSTRNILVQATLANPDRVLVPGMFANVQVLLPEQREVVTVPRTAVSYSLYGDSVFIVNEAQGEQAPDGEQALVVERRFVRVGETQGDETAIAEGVKPGERVVIAGQLKLQDGARVRINNSVALNPPAETPRQ